MMIWSLINRVDINGYPGDVPDMLWKCPGDNPALIKGGISL
jgi:hypothetical protein